MRGAPLILAATFLVAACGSDNAAVPAASTAPTATAAPTTPTPAPVTYPMAGVGAGNAGVTGTADVTKFDGHFTVRVRLKGLVAGSTHVAHIHTGSCAANGAIVYALTSVVADASGNGDSVTDLQQPYVGVGWYANVHVGPDLTTPENRPGLACGNLAA